MMRHPASNALRFVVRVNYHSALRLCVQRNPFVIRRGFDPDDRLFTTDAGFDVLTDWSSFIHFRKLFVGLPAHPRF